jgi:hypothetical protein
MGLDRVQEMDVSMLLSTKSVSEAISDAVFQQQTSIATKGLFRRLLDPGRLSHQGSQDKRSVLQTTIRRPLK